MDYKKFYILQETFDGSVYTPVSGATPQNSYAVWKVVCQEMPLMYLPEQKTPATREWFDEHGEDVFIPSDGVKFKAYDLEATFLYVGPKTAIYADLKGFVNFLYGRNEDGSPLLAIYDEYTRIGLHGLYVSKIDNELLDISDNDEEALSRFKVTFRATDPVRWWDVAGSVSSS